MTNIYQLRDIWTDSSYMYSTSKSKSSLARTVFNTNLIEHHGMIKTITLPYTITLADTITGTLEQHFRGVTEEEKDCQWCDINVNGVI